MGVRGACGSNHSSTQHGECAGHDRFRSSASIRHAVRPLSRNGTDEAAPLWNGPRLRPAFVAQVLGQVMMDRAPASGAAAAYRQPVAQIARGAFFNGDV